MCVLVSKVREVKEPYNECDSLAFFILQLLKVSRDDLSPGINGSVLVMGEDSVLGYHTLSIKVSYI